MEYRHYILLLYCSVLAVPALTQQPFFRDYDLPEDLRRTTIRQLYQADGDLLWLGTDDGLFWFDGHRFERMLRPDSSGVQAVTGLYRDSRQQLWVGYRDGALFRHAPFQELQSWMPEEGWPKTPVTAFAEDSNGNLWLATYGEGLYYWDGRRLYNFGLDDGLSGDEVYTITADRRGRIWAATDRGISICWLDQGHKRVQKLGRREGLPDEIVRIIEPDESGNCWVGTYERGFGYVSGTDGSVQYWVPEWPFGIITAIEQVSPDELWIGTDKMGVCRYRINERELFRTSISGEQTGRINDLHRDAEGNMWVLLNNNELQSASLLFEFIDEGIQQVQAILIDDQDRMWVGTQEGLYLLKEQNSGSPSFALQRKGNFLSLFQDHYHNIWAGTFGSGVYIFKPGTRTEQHLSEAEGLTNGSILSIDGYGEHVWLATLGGVSAIRFTRDPALPGSMQFRNYRHEDGLGTNFIFKVLVDSRRQVWFATDGEGLSQLQGDTFLKIASADSVRIKSVYSMAEDHDGHIWFCSPQEGIFRYDGRQTTRFKQAGGLRETNIVGMVTDNKNQVLLIHPAGIDLFNPREQHLIHYDAEVGMGDIQPNLNAFFPDRNGNIWIGTQRGIIRYKGALPIRQSAPQAHLMGLSVDLQAVNPNEVHSFPHHRNNLVFDYSGLWYSDPESIRYRYKLEGFNPDWIISRDQQAVYSQLPPGDYTFLLSASDNDIFFPPAQVSYTFRVTPPWWQTPWFAVFLTLVILSTIYLTVRYREQQLNRLATIRREKLIHQFELLKSQINPHFLFNNFNTLVTLIEENPPAAVNYVERLSDFYRNILQYRESPVISMVEELELLHNYAALLKERFANNLHINICDKLHRGYIIPLTLQLLVENAIKHNKVGRDHPLTIEVSAERPGYVIVRNNLQEKWSKAPSSTGFGLESIIKRYALLTDEKVYLEKSEEQFSVGIPLLTAVTM